MPSELPKDKFIITHITNSNREQVLDKLEREYGLKYSSECHKVCVWVRINIQRFSEFNYTAYTPYSTNERTEYTFITASEFLDWISTKPTKPKKEKQEVFINKFHIWEKVFVFTEWKIEHKEIDAIIKFQYELNFWENNPVFFEENQLYKTKSQLIKSLSKKWREEVEERILSLSK